MTGVNDSDLIAPIPSWFVMFTGEDRRRHLSDWLSPLAFQHVLAFAFDAAANRWIVYDVNRGGTAIVALTRTMFDQWLLYMLSRKARVLKIGVRPTPRVWLRCGMACVGAVRHLLGARSWALRPIGLWRDLKRAGAREVFKEMEDGAAADANLARD